jgi:hypothetical protein|tara:strand:- start:790 stop:1035 length:246 start_codon:yes stop_codon:yes gene_type:complete
VFLPSLVAFDAFRTRLVRFQKRLALWFAHFFDLRLRVDWIVDIPDVHLDLSASHVFSSICARCLREKKKKEEKRTTRKFFP